MSLKVKLLASLVGVGFAGGTGAGVYLLQSKEEDKVSKEQKEKFSGSLVFERETKTEDSKTLESYTVEFSDDKKESMQDKECKFEDDENNKLVCKIADLIDKEKIKKYLSDLSSKLKNLEKTENENFSPKLKEKLEETKFESFFDEDIYKKIEKIIK